MGRPRRPAPGRRASARAIALAVAPVLGALAALAATRALRRRLRRGTRRWRDPVRVGEWAMSAWLAFSHGANDAQKAVGVLAALLVADGRLATPSAPTWAVLACAAALTAGTALGGWRIVKKVGRGIYRIQPVDGLASQAASAGVIFGASLARRAGVDLAGRRLVDRRRRRRAPPLAARALGGRRRHGARVGAHDPRDGGARRPTFLLCWSGIA